MATIRFFDNQNVFLKKNDLNIGFLISCRFSWFGMLSVHLYNIKIGFLGNYSIPKDVIKKIKSKHPSVGDSFLTNTTSSH